MCGGLFDVIENLNVKQIIIGKQLENSENYLKFKELVKHKKIKVSIVGATSSHTQRFNIEQDLYLDILWPNNLENIQENILNNNSLVCKLYFKNFSMLFTGDIEEAAEEAILQEYKNNLGILNATILKVAHHGSKTSSMQKFIRAVKPKIALIGVGENNKFGHPNSEIISRLENYGIRIYRTDIMGEITIVVNNREKIKVKRNINA